ncbi:1-acyl-sn-glycerol-3-phosphate acyltransferase [Siculibacillus lacustris]|uniref:1-acyl-sn-glycerol-3-phosphate acyltransferase n=1 Tax=Siculibacillus lacustris TaxID=1549641 RepID=A0A4Q9VNT1_9HYPH|nr:lysophospholipid acyltransferase family protein [Siculibacillus lacustris]TBW36414.1 1-acyl-sn-glycerol-3-phosphate acyltransferase [Siculibacillus lacustris]
MIRVVAVLALLRLAAITVAALPVQWVALRLGSSLADRLPVWWHRRALATLGVRVTPRGTPSSERPLLITANHASWLDISVIGSLGPVSFVAKSEVATWPVFGLLAKLQRCVFVDRTRRSATGRTAGELGDRLAAGDPMVLFPEGTSSPGDGVLPFRSALLGAARAAILDSGHTRVVVQPMAVVYTRIGGMPIGRADRHRVAWYGDMDLIGHLWGVCIAGGLDVEVVWGEPQIFEATTDRKALAATLETSVRDQLRAVLRP